MESSMRKFISLCTLSLLLLTACQSSEAAEETAASPDPTLVQPIINTAVPPTNTPPPPVIEQATADTVQPTATDSPPTAEPPSPTPTETPIPENPVSSITLEPIISGLIQPLYLTHAFDERIFIVEQAGTIRILQNGELLPEPFLDIMNPVNSNSNEQGLLGLAFHPNYQENGYFFLNYTNLNGGTNIARFRVSSDPNVADPDS